MSRRGFTLIELLITVSIIAVLSAVAMMVYSDVLRDARDARRKQDLQAIAQALEVYYQKNNRYPISNNWNLSTSANWIIDTLQPTPVQMVPTYISSLTQDPKGNGGNPWQDGQFSYAYCGDNQSCYTQCGLEGSSTYIKNGQWYILVAQLENRSDPDRLEVKDNKWCNGQSIYLNPDLPGWSKYSYVITPR